MLLDNSYLLVIVFVVSSAISVVVVTWVGTVGLVDTHHVVSLGGDVSVLFANPLELYPRTADRRAVAVTGSCPLRERGLAFATERDVFGDVIKGLGNVFLLLSISQFFNHHRHHIKKNATH